MTINELVSAISLKHNKEGIVLNPPASLFEIQNLEIKLGFVLPNDFKDFYSICNGFECNEDIFNFIPVNSITQHKEDHGEDWFYFSEYMIYSDLWAVRINIGDNYEIINTTNVEIILTNSLHEFLERFLRGNVFDKGGLYDWQNEFES